LETLYFIRIGGTAMGGVAGACAALGDSVFGSEQDLYEPMKSYLEDAGVSVFRSFDPANMLACQPTHVVVGNAVSRGNEELEVALEQKLNCISLPELIGERLIGKKTSVVVAGTHGKTTTTAMTAAVLETGGLDPGFLIGGVPGNFDVSCRPGGGSVFVIEGDEYDSAYFDKRSKFLHYRPDIAVVNNIEFDHADIFDDLEAVKKTFRLFIRLVPRNGVVLANGDDPNVLDVLKVACSPVETFGFADGCFWRATDLSEGPTGSTFGVWRDGSLFGEFSSPANGRFNALNMLVAIATGHRLGMDLVLLQRGVSTYLSPKRRMQEVGMWHGALVIDDFGHHPTAIRETLAALIAKYPGRRVIACFEPRSNTTTRAFYAKEIEECFEGCAAVAFGALDRPERYSEEERLDTEGIARRMTEGGVPAMAITLEQGREKDWGRYIFQWLKGVVREGDLLVTFSNGSFGGLLVSIRD
jgi:UDP-N-acetylmuramate: L-alanyl-gamma-D-glutamyl-meso-diaminopimelate ligase